MYLLITSLLYVGIEFCNTKASLFRSSTTQQNPLIFLKNIRGFV